VTVLADHDPPPDGDDRVDVELVDDASIVDQWTLPRWVLPLDEYAVNGVIYDVYAFTGPIHQRDGRSRFRIFVRPRPIRPADSA
jgi:hypothetical protein